MDAGLSPESEAERLRRALEAYDEEAANAILDRAVAAFALDSMLGGIVLPAMSALGDRWRIAFLGSETPLDTITGAARQLSPAAVVLAAVSPVPFRASLSEIRALARTTRVVLGAAGASPELAHEAGAEYLAGPPTAAAASLSS